MQAAADTAPPEQRRFRLRRVLTWTAVVVGVALLAYLLGWDIRAWFKELWDTLTEISVEYLVAAAILQTTQTVLTAVAWYQILRFAYPSRVGKKEVLACYATSVALNGFLPANLGTLVMLLMLVAVIAGATFAGVFAGYLVEKIFFTVIGAVVYLYLFLSVGGSFDIKFKWVHEYPVIVIAGLAGAAVLVLIVVRLSARSCTASGRMRRRAARSSPGPATTSCVPSCPSSARGARSSA